MDWQHGVDELRTVYRAERNGGLRHCHQVLRLVREGELALEEIGHLVGAAESAVIRWVNWHPDGGLAAVRRMGKGH